MHFVIRLGIAIFLGAVFLWSRAEAELPENTAAGTFLPEGGVPTNLTHAAALVDEMDSERPVILILSDRKLAVENWHSEFAIMRARPEFTGVLFWIDKEGKIFRTDIYRAGNQSSVSGYFELKLIGPMGNDLAGTAKSSEPVGNGPRLEAAFHAKLN